MGGVICDAVHLYFGLQCDVDMFFVSLLSFHPELGVAGESNVSMLDEYMLV